MMRKSRYFYKLPTYILAMMILCVVRLISPFFLVRIGRLESSRVGHFAANTELYLCERDEGINVPVAKWYKDIFFMENPICNKQLAIMWKRELTVGPTWLLAPIARLNRKIKGGSVHEVGGNSQSDRDIHNLLDKYPAHLSFSREENVRGIKDLGRIGLPVGAKFVCLIVRDSAYLSQHLKGFDFSYHDYRDTSIGNYIMMAEDLVDRGYFVLRMGVAVLSAMNTRNPMIIDYAYNGLRTDFLDVYLGAKCEFCISVGTGFDAIPTIFRRPVVYVNLACFGYFFTSQRHTLGIFMRFFSSSTNKSIVFKDLVRDDVGFCLNSIDFEAKDVRLAENTPEEIRDVVVEMVLRLEGRWRIEPADELLQARFWEIFPSYAIDAYQRVPLHGEIRARFGSAFLRTNPEWLQ